MPHTYKCRKHSDNSIVRLYEALKQNSDSQNPLEQKVTKWVNRAVSRLTWEGEALMYSIPHSESYLLSQVWHKGHNYTLQRVLVKWQTSQWSHKCTQELLAFSAHQLLLLSQQWYVLVECRMVVHTPMGLSANLAGSHYQEAPLLHRLHFLLLLLHTYFWGTEQCQSRFPAEIQRSRGMWQVLWRQRCTLLQADLLLIVWQSRSKQLRWSGSEQMNFPEH